MDMAIWDALGRTLRTARVSDLLGGYTDRMRVATCWASTSPPTMVAEAEQMRDHLRHHRRSR